MLLIIDAAPALSMLTTLLKNVSHPHRSFFSRIFSFFLDPSQF
jgi:hypothetical protein